MTPSCRLPLVVDIKRNSFEDGPGIRSVVFFKGCPMDCIFCHNPETQEAGPEIAFFPSECIECGGCDAACHEGAIEMGPGGRIKREWCTRCGACAGACPSGAIRLIGKYYPVGELVDILLRDEPFYRHSSGGVTLSGGECTQFPDYLEEVLKELKWKGIHITLETAGLFNYKTFGEKILPYLDLVYYDIKFADPAIHRRYTGRTNGVISENLRLLLKEGSVEVHPRIPVVPGLTDSRENLSAIVDLLFSLGAQDISLLPYNPMGFDMAKSLGKQIPPLPLKFMSKDEEGRVSKMFGDIVATRTAD